MIRKAEVKDLDRIEEIYKRIHQAEREGKLQVGWEDGVYPVRKTAETALEKDELYVCEEDGMIYASAVLNKNQLDSYRDAKWETDASDDEVMVMHTLSVDPQLAGRGTGRAFVEFYEEYTKKAGCRVMRIDTQDKNLPARALYRKYGFTETDMVPCIFNGIPDVNLVMLEKEIKR